jgi:hypothetical protein
MLSVQLAESAATAASDYEYRPDHFANDLTLFKQPRLGVSLDGLLDAIRYRKDFTDFEQNKSGIASIILLAHNMGLVSEQEIDRCVTDGWREIYFLYRSSMKSIVEYLGNESGMIAGEKAKHDSYESLRMSLAIEKTGGAYIYLSAGMRYSQFYLVDLNDELRRVIYSCFNWIVNELGFGILANDFVGASASIYEEMDDYKRYREQHPELNREELAELMFNNEDHDSILVDFAEEPEYLIERFEFLDLILANSVESQFGTVMSMDEIRAAVIRWRRSEPETFSSSWVGFINQTIRAWKWFRRCTLFDQSKIMEGCEYGGAGVSLHYAHFVGLGLPWEDAVVVDAAQNIYEAGDVPIAKLNIKPVAIPQVAEKLMMLAKARGLLRLAEITNFGEDSE